MRRALTRSQLKVRMLRALSGLSQEDFERAAQVENVAGFEHGQRQPSQSQLARMAAAAALTPDDCEELLRDYEARAATTEGGTPDRRLALPGADRTIESVIDDFEARLAVRQDGSAAREAERQEAREAWKSLSRLLVSEEMALVVGVAREYQTWALAELLCKESARSGSKGESLDLARLAVKVAGEMRAAEAWTRRVRGYALHHLAAAQDRAGLADDAEASRIEAERLWESGADPDEVLDPPPAGLRIRSA